MLKFSGYSPLTRGRHISCGHFGLAVTVHALKDSLAHDVIFSVTSTLAPLLDTSRASVVLLRGPESGVDDPASSQGGVTGEASVAHVAAS